MPLANCDRNASREFTKAKIKDMIEHQQTAYKWQFTFLGANQDAFAEAQGLGSAAASAGNYTPQKAIQVYAAASANVGRMRGQCATGQSVNNAYTPQERKDMSAE